MQTRREYLADKGLAIAGARGKFSNAGKVALVEAEKAGVKFSDGAPVPRVMREVDSEPAPAQKSSRFVDYLYPSDFAWPEIEFEAVEKVTGKSQSMREVCNNCRVSLVMCTCGDPTIYGSIAVTIRERR